MSHRLIHRLCSKALYALLLTVPLISAAHGSMLAKGILSPGQESPLPPLPEWHLSPAKPADMVPQIRVLRASPSATTLAPGATFNVTVSFVAESRVSADYALDLSLVDAHGSVLVSKHDNLNNNLLILPTRRWLGPIAITLPLTVPSSAQGNIYLMLSLSGAHGPVALSGAPGIQQDKQYRYCVGALTVRSSASAPHLTPPAKLDLSRYELSFDDEFTTASISDAPSYDRSRWYTQNEQCCMAATDGARTAMAGRLSPHNPFQLMSPHGLTIRLERNADLWTSGVLTSVDSKGRGFSQQYGYFEMRAHFPTGLNTWPAFWLLNTASKSSGAPAGEIDVVEYIANPAFSSYIATTLHDWKDHTTPALSHSMVDLPTDGFHTYGMLWTAATMTFFVDGGVTFQCPTPAIMHQPYYLLVDLGLGSGWPTEATPPRNDLQIQYIRVYKER
jgi:beta-glucanase (GH16 family)